MPKRINELVLDIEKKPGGHESKGSFYPSNEGLWHKTLRQDDLKRISYNDDYLDLLHPDIVGEVPTTNDNQTFTTQMDFVHIIPFRGLLRQHEGAENDFQILSPNSFRFNFGPIVKPVLVNYFIKSRFVEKEVVFSTSDNITFTSIPSAKLLTVTRNGAIAHPNIDYTIISDTQIQFTYTLNPTDVVKGKIITSKLRIDETLSRIDANTYETLESFERIDIWRGLLQSQGVDSDYVISGSNQITFASQIPENQPVIGDYIIKP